MAAERPRTRLPPLPPPALAAAAQPKAAQPSPFRAPLALSQPSQLA